MFVTIFNSFTSYVQVFDAYSRQVQQNQQTSFSLSSASFVVPTPTVSTPSTPSTSTSQLAVAYSPDDKVVYAQGLWWLFYSSGASIVYRTSSDGAAWSAATTVTSSTTSTTGITFNIWISGTTLYYVLSNALSSASFLWRYGTLNVGGTITWTIAETSVTTAHTANDYDSIVTDNSGNVWVALTTHQGATYYIEVYKYSGGAWALENTISGVTVTTAPDLESVTSGIVLIYGQGGTTTGTVTLITTATGASWTAAVSPASQYAMFLSSAVTVGNTVYFAGMAASSGAQATGTVNLWNFTYGGASISAEKTLKSTAGGWYTSITQASSTTFLLFYGSGTSLYYIYSTDSLALWSSEQTISTSETSLIGISSSNTRGGIAWVSGAASPYNVRFAFVTPSSNWQITSSYQNSSPFAVHLISFYLYDINSSSLVDHLDTNSTAPGVSGLFDQWVGAGQSSPVTVTFNWTHKHDYLITTTTDQGVIESATFVAPG